jgi:hypothetical protein
MYIFYIFLDFVIGGKQFCPSDDICFPVDVSGDTMWPRKKCVFCKRFNIGTCTFRVVSFIELHVVLLTEYIEL